MSDPTFVWASEYDNSQETRAPRILEADFGDGYVQVAGDGINPDPQQWDLGFTGVADGFITDIENFLIERGGYKPFFWLTPNGAACRVKCKTWQRMKVEFNWDRITATFTEVFDTTPLDSLIMNPPALILS